VIWEFADVVGRRLVAWGLASVAVGVPMAALGDAWWRGFGAMAIAWGAIDAGIGVAARVLAERNRRRSIGDQASRDRDTGRLRRLLLVNAGLDVGYVALGAWLAATAGGDAWRAGAGWGIVVQGAFLLGFDLVHARWVPPAGPLLPEGVTLFEGPGHDPFRLVRAASGDARPGADDPGALSHDAGATRGALLVHGFAGSPRELRGLAAVLAADGWIVEVPLLPGHGPAFRDVADYRLEDWLAAVEAGAAALRESGASTLLVAGHSVGASLAMATAGRLRADALVLLAPFAWPVPGWQGVLGPLLRVVLPPWLRVFDRVDLATPEARAALEAFLPGADLDDPAVVAAVRETRVPLSLLEQLFRVSSRALGAAPAVRVPVLAVLGTLDTVSRPAQSRALLARLPAPPAVLELPAGHDLVSEASPVRDRVLGEVLGFARRVSRRPPSG
jgi:esterase/lipase